MRKSQPLFTKQESMRLLRAEKTMNKALSDLPADFAAERQVLGRCIVDMSWGNHEIVSAIDVTDFYLENNSFHGWLYGVIARECRITDPESHLRYLLKFKREVSRLGVANYAYELATLMQAYDVDRESEMFRRLKDASRIRKVVLRSAIAIDRGLEEWHRHAVKYRLLGDNL